MNFQNNQNYQRNDTDYPQLGGNQQQQQWGQQQYQGQQYGNPNQYQQQPQFNQYNPAPQFQQQPVNQAPDTNGAPDNPFAAAAGGNPFGGGGGMNPFSAPAFEFKPKGVIDLGDDGAPAFDDFIAPKKKKQDAASLRKEAEAKKQAELDKLPTKGKPSEFFIMDYAEGDMNDPTGGCRLPTQEQKLFIFANYPMSAQLPAMIGKIYELYFFAKDREDKAAEAAIYSKGPKRQQIMESSEEEDTNFGQPIKKNKKNPTGQKKPARVMERNDKPREKKEEKPKVEKPKVVKDIVVEADKDVVQVETNKQPASIVFIGHVDAGKSTISGQIIYQMGVVDEREIAKFKAEAKQKDRDSWWLAYVMDNSEEEKQKGKTVEIGRAQFDTPTKQFTIFDAPGHKDYVPNMIQGAALADYGGLVISARKGEFEAGFEQQGQSREHIQLARSLGVQKLVIVINKMDEAPANWKRQRYDQIKEDLLPFILSVGYKEEDLFWVPISGLHGINIKDRVEPNLCNWYKGPSLLEILDELPVENRDPNGPLRIPILDKMKDATKMIIHGKVESGTVKLGDKLSLSPNNLPCQVLQITDSKNQLVEYARPGENVQVKLNHLTEEQIQSGMVLSIRESPMPSSQLFEAELDLLELVDSKPILSKGYQCMIHIHTFSDEVNIKDLVWSVEKDPNTKELTKKERPKYARSYAKLLCRMQSNKPIPLEKASDMASLGRFTLRDEGKTIAVGRIMKYKPFKDVPKPLSGGPAAQEKKPEVVQASTAGDLVFDAETGKVGKKKEELQGIPEE